MSTSRKPPTINPGGVVSGTNFFGRDEEVKHFWEEIDKERHLLFVSPRRVGKTSLMQAIASKKRAPWTAVYVDLQGKTTAVGVLQEILTKVGQAPGLGKRMFDAFCGAVSQGVRVSAAGMSIELGKQAKEDWDGLAARLEASLLGQLSESERLLLMLDEFPVALGELFKDPATEQEARRLLRFFRKMRLDKDNRGRFAMVIGGSIGLMPLLRKHKISADANDLHPFRIGPWSEATANAFMDGVAKSERFDLPATTRGFVLDRTGRNPIPFHLQKMLAALKDLGIAADKIAEEDVDDVWMEILEHLDLDHYRERIGSIFPDEEAALALNLLDKITTDGPVNRQDLVAALGNEARCKVVLRILISDGYLVETRQGQSRIVTFANPMLAKFWKEF
ncbi:hypothetical protein [Hyphomicrobium sp. CS1BSMeth3]|uniref:hypothetical protein n=1 Tax=Hyphomicrobium sp. CS1BSMeth3 TaxID=1892844 RepID=UPI000931422A|nr:hypothetical protein [Hyphomicrobium sp. CS1BSMeth3]